MALSTSETRAFYDRFGAKQDTQSFYEDPALDDLVAHARFAEAGAVFELGCGTGRFAARLLSEQLPGSATYVGCDVSSTMVRIAKARLARFSPRAQVLQCDGAARFPLPDDAVGRVVSTYVLDLLPQQTTEKCIREAHRVLGVGGRLCLVSLTNGTTLVSRIVSASWAFVHRMRPSLVGGCRPVRLAQYVDPRRWELEYENVAVAWGVPSEVLVARARQGPSAGAAKRRG